MKMKLNPVYEKELKTRVRTFKFALTVMLYNLILVGIALFGFEMVFNVHWNNTVNYSGATTIYLVLICLEIGMIVFMIPSYTAGSIAGEREKQTLEILLTTVMKPRQILFGKLLSSISMVVFLVFSSLPVLSIVFTIGGIGLANLCQFVIVALITAIFIGSIGILASCMFRKTVQATVASFAFVLIVCGVTVAITGIAFFLKEMYFYNVLGGLGKTPNIGWAALPMLLNPVVTLVSMVGSQYGDANIMREILNEMGGLPEFFGENWFILSLGVQLLFSLLLLRLSEKLLNPLRKMKYRKKNRKNKSS